MNKNVQIEVLMGGGQSEWLVLPDNSTITVKRSSNLFDRGDIFSYSFRVVAAANRHILKNAATAHGELLRDLLQEVPANIYVYGTMYASGYLKVGTKDFDEDGEIDLSFYGGRKSFDKMITNKNASDIPLLSKVQLGWAHDRICKVKGFIRYWAQIISHGAFPADNHLDALFTDGIETLRYPKFVIVKGDLAEYMNDQQGPVNRSHYDYTNTYHAYDDSQPTAHPYCNIPVAYTRYVRVQKSGDKKEFEDEKRREYHISDACRINSAPNFYVMYWLRCLFKSLDIEIVENQMAEVEDLTRLFFVNTSLKYDEDDTTVQREWSAYCEEEGSDIPGKGSWNAMTGAGFWGVPIVNLDECKLEVIYDKNAFSAFGYTIGVTVSDKPIGVGIDLVPNYKFYAAYATPKNFPEEAVDSVLEELERAFGVRFVFSDDMKTVRIVLLNKVLRQNTYNHIPINISGVNYNQSDIKGLRWVYGNGSGVQYNYPPFDKFLYPRAKAADTGYTIYDQWELNKRFPQIVEEVSETNATCYIDPDTGNAYRIAVDADTLFNATLLEVGAYEAAIEGDVDVDDDYIKEETIGFTPLQMNLIDGQYALYVGDDMKSSFYDPAKPDTDKWLAEKNQGGSWVRKNNYQGYGLIEKVGNVNFKADMQMTPRYDEESPITAWEQMKVIASVGFAACYPDNFDYDGEKDSPIESAVDGFSLCLLRGPADQNETICDIPAPEHDEQDTVRGWEASGGTGINVHPDSCTEQGELFDYNGGFTGLSDATPTPDLTRAIEACTRLGIDSNVWAPRLVAATPRTITRNVRAADEQAAVVETRYDGFASIMYCTADAYVVFHRRENDVTLIQIRRILFTPIWESQTLSLKTYRDYCAIIQSAFAQAEVNDAEHVKIFPQLMEDTLTILADEGHSDIADHIIPIFDMQEPGESLETRIAEFAGWWRYVMYDNPDVDPDKAGRFSLKLRAEKPNPFYISTLPDTVSTKQDAGEAMQKLYTTSNTDLLTRPKVPFTTMRAAGWDCPGDGYATVLSVGYGVKTKDGVIHEILWSPIKPDGTVKTPAQLQEYVASFERLEFTQLISHDTDHLILDINTTEERAEILHELQAIYYADDGEQVDSVDISPINSRYLNIGKEELQRRGLVDVFLAQYKEYLLYGRTATFEGVMPYEDFLNIDELSFNEIGGCTGLIKNMQATLGGEAVSVKIELLYL